MAAGSARVLLSYARADGAALAERLRHDLSAAGIEVWLDTAKIEGGQGWSREVERAIDRAQAVIAVMTNASFVSDICRAEHLRSLRKRRRVVPLLAQPGVDRPLYFEHLNCVLPGSDHVLIATPQECAIWDLVSGAMVRRITDEATVAATVTHDGRRVVTAGGNQRVAIARLDGGMRLASFEAPGTVSALSISADDRYLLVGFGRDHHSWKSGLGGGGVRLWDLDESHTIATFSTEGAVRCCLMVERGSGPVVVAGDETGRMYFLEVMM